MTNYITEDYVSFEVAKLLKEKGFEQECDYATSWYAAQYFKNAVLGEWFEGEHQIIEGIDDKCTISYLSDKDIFIPAPTLQMAMKWLREKHGIIILVNFYRKDRFSYDILLDGECGDNYILHSGYMFEHFKTYEEAVEAALKWSLKNLFNDSKG